MKVCGVPDCDRKHESKGLCKSHAQRARSGASLYCGCGSPIPLARGSHAVMCRICYEGRACSHMDCNALVHQRGYCSAHYMKWYRGVLVEARCIVCDSPTGSPNHHQKYCSKCLPVRLKELGSISQHRRRSAHREPYSRHEVFKLDCGTCYLCQSMVVYDQSHLDHILPVSRGGHDALYNVALVHSHCNQRKNATLPENLIAKFPRLAFPERFVAWIQ